jgi:uncharacterized protein (TIGR03437 family)
MTSRSLKSRFSILPALAFMALAVPSALSQTLTITAGQGQLLQISQQSQPLTVVLVGSNGQPIPGAAITFTAVDAFGGYVPYQPVNVVTDANGSASATYIGANLTPGFSNAYDTGIVTATYQGIATVNFYETTSNLNLQGGTLVTANFSQVNTGQTYTGAAGSTSPSPFQVFISSSTTGPVPNVAISLVIDPTSTGTISCLEGTFILSNAQGIAQCTPVFGKVGTGTFTVNAGNAVNSQQPIPFTVTVGPPALITINSGNNQSGTPGKQLPLPIVATVTDLGGNPTPNIPMTFTSVTPNGATFTNVRQVTDNAGKVSANVVLGSVPGNIQISLADTGGIIRNPAIFNETVNVTLTGLTKSTGDQQSAFINAPFPTPLTVNVSSSQGALAGTPVTFAVTSGSATVATPNATTDPNGNASTTVTAGATAGPVVVTASAGGFSVNFNLTVIPPGPSNLSFTNGASGALNAMAPGAIVTIYGSGIANNIQGVTSAFDVGPMPITMAGVTVQFGQAYAPIFDVGNVSGSQFVSVLVPYEVPAGSATVTIKTAGGGMTTVPVTILQASPGLFTYAGANNQQYIVAIKANGTVASPTNPANRGETVVIYVTGLPLTPGIGTNAFPAPGSTAAPAYPIILGVANQGAAYSSVAYSPDLLGVETITFTVPSSVTPGPVQISIGVQAPSGTQYSQGATLSVQ